MTLNSVIIKYLSERCGCDVTTPAGSAVLANDIEAKTGEKLSANTIKRLMGIIPYRFIPRSSTLDIIAKYLGFSSWDLFLAKINDSISDFNVENPFIEVNELGIGDEVSFKWEPDRRIRLRHRGDGICEVIEVENSKLTQGDLLHLIQLAEGYPLMAKEVIRDGKSLGNYTTAKTKGIYGIRIIGR
ncbi:MAG: hypothetical protein K2N05_13000 [Muribaculaceae bacterium]|nr:hypothetical protein [Muribaculaceae bacterium]